MTKFFVLLFALFSFDAYARQQMEDWEAYLVDLQRVGVFTPSQVEKIKKMYPTGFDNLEEAEVIFKHSDAYFEFDLRKHRGVHYEDVIRDFYTSFTRKFFPELNITDIKTKLHKRPTAVMSGPSQEVTFDSSAYLRISYNESGVSYSDGMFNLRSYYLYWKENSQADPASAPSPNLFGYFFNEVLASKGSPKRIYVPYYARTNSPETLGFLVVNEDQYNSLRTYRTDLFSTTFQRQKLAETIQRIAILAKRPKLSNNEEFSVAQNYREQVANHRQFEYVTLMNSFQPPIAADVSFLRYSPVNYLNLLRKASIVSNGSFVPNDLMDNSELLKNSLSKEKAVKVYNCTFTLNGKKQTISIPIRLDEDVYRPIEQTAGTMFLSSVNKLIPAEMGSFYLVGQTSGDAGAEYLIFLNPLQKKSFVSQGITLYFK